MTIDEWRKLEAGDGCMLCAPREPNTEHGREIARLSCSTLYLFSDQRFRGYCLLVFDLYHATVLEDLPEADYRGFLADVRRSAQAIRKALNPDHLNFELLGNSVPHLHWHIIPRYQDDPRWGGPIWEGWPPGEFEKHRVALTEQQYAEMIASIRAGLA